MSYDEVDLGGAAVPYQCMAGAYEDMELDLDQDALLLDGYDVAEPLLESDENGEGTEAPRRQVVIAAYEDAAAEGYDVVAGYDNDPGVIISSTRAPVEEIPLTDAQREKLKAEEARKERMRKYYTAMRQLEAIEATPGNCDVPGLLAVMEEAAGDLQDVGEFFHCMQQHTAVSLYEQTNSRFSKQLRDSALMEGPGSSATGAPLTNGVPGRAAKAADEFDVVMRYSYAVAHSYSSVAVQEMAFSGSETEEEDAAPKAHSAPLHNRDWNEEFQSLLAMPDCMAKFLGLRQLEHDFVHTAEIYGKIIIGESCLPDHLKTVKPIDIGGIAGGQKFICQGILFKFAVDTVGLYRGDDNAAKAAGLELNALMHYFYCNMSDLHVPLMALIDFRGFRLMAVSLLPIGSASICYGTANAGITVHANPKFEKIMREVGTILNVKPHAVGQDRVVIYGGPGDIEGHEGKDGRMYLLDFARLAPPMPPKAPGQTLYRHFRMEFVKAYEKPLCSDSYSRMAPDPGYEHVKEIKEAFAKFENEVVPALAKKLEQGGLEVLPSSATVACVFHKAGVNLRFIGSVRQLVTNAGVRRLLLEEAIARCIKCQLHRLFREKMKQIGVPSDEPFRRVVVDLVGLVLGQKEPYSKSYWATHVPAMLDQKFPGSLAEEEQGEGALFAAVNLRSLVARLLTLSAVELTAEAQAYLTDESLPLQEFELLDQDLLQLSCRTRHMNIIEYADGMSLFHQALSKGQRAASKKRLLILSKSILLKALHSSSMNSLAQYQLGNVFRVMAGQVSASCGSAPAIASLGDAVKAFRQLLAQRIDHALHLKATVSLAKTLWARGRLLSDDTAMVEAVDEATALLAACLEVGDDFRCAYLRAKIFAQAAPVAASKAAAKARALEWFTAAEAALVSLLARKDCGDRAAAVALLLAGSLLKRWLLLPASVENSSAHAREIADTLAAAEEEKVTELLAAVKEETAAEYTWQLFAVASALGPSSSLSSLILSRLAADGVEELSLDDSAVAACGVAAIKGGLGQVLSACPSIRSLTLSTPSLSLSDVTAALPPPGAAPAGVCSVAVTATAPPPTRAELSALLAALPALTSLSVSELSATAADDSAEETQGGMATAAVSRLSLGAAATALLLRAPPALLARLEALEVEGLDDEAAAARLLRLLAASCPALRALALRNSAAVPGDLPCLLATLPLQSLNGSGSAGLGLEQAAGAGRQLPSLREAILSSGSRFLYGAGGWRLTVSKPGHGAVRLAQASLLPPGEATGAVMRVTRANLVGANTDMAVASDCGGLFSVRVAPLMQGMQTTLTFQDLNGSSLGSLKLQRQILGHVTTQKGSGVVCGLAVGVECRQVVQMQSKMIDVSLLIDNAPAVSWKGRSQAMGYNGSGSSHGDATLPLSLLTGIGLCLYQFLAP